jgi:phosphoglycerol transferase MdoB-like AlkP superfamily enzyme
MSTPPGDQPDRRRWIPRQTLFFLGLIALLILLFELLRLGLMLRNRSSIAGAAPGALLSSFIYGLRFDLAVACYIALPAVIIGHLPGLGLRHSRTLRRILLPVLVGAVGIIIFLLLAEYEFFHEFQSRYNQLAFQYLDHPGIVVGMAWYNYPVIRYVLVCALLVIAFGFALRWIARHTLIERPDEPVKPLHEGIAMALLIGLMVIAMRGGLQSEPLQWGDAYHSSNDFVNQMGLNGLFALGQSGLDHFRHQRASAWLTSMPIDEARSIARGMIVAPNEKLIDPDTRTVLRATTRPADALVTLRKGPRPPNVVLVIMESFSARFIGACGSSPDHTPCFDQLAADGVIFDHMFSGGTHTHQGVFCSMLGFPNLPRYEYLMENIVSNQPFLTLPTILKRQGYQTLFLYNGNLSWDNMEGFFRKQGIDHFVGADSFQHPAHRDKVWGVMDQDVFDRANQEFEQADAKGPFFSLILTLSNHVPFDLPDPLPFPRTTDMGDLNRRTDGVRYADWAVGQFIEKAKKLKYFQNTLFVFVGDHGFHVDPKLTEANVLFHHIPLLFYSPLLSKKGLVMHEVAGQVNILPTILGLLKSRSPQASWGRDLFSPEFKDDNFTIFKGSGGEGPDQAVVMVRGDKLLVIGSDKKTAVWRYELNPKPSITPLDDPAGNALRDQMHKEVSAYVEAAMTDLIQERAGGIRGGQHATPNELLHSADRAQHGAAVVPPGT